MKIVTYACIPVRPFNGSYRRARIVTYIAPDPDSIMEYDSEATYDFLPDSVVHQSCNHKTYSFRTWEHSQDLGGLCLLGCAPASHCSHPRTSDYPLDVVGCVPRS